MEDYENVEDLELNDNTDSDDYFMRQMMNDDLNEPTESSDPTFSERISASPSNFMMDSWMHQMDRDRSGITFVIPNSRDNQQIDDLVRLRELMEKVGNAAAHTVAPSFIDSRGQAISHEQISQSAVLNLADLQNSPMNHSQRMFMNDFDMNSVINYLWIIIVTALVFLSLVFLLFSFYFYKKFRQWKKCSKYYFNSNLEDTKILSIHILNGNYIFYPFSFLLSSFPYPQKNDLYDFVIIQTKIYGYK